MAHFGRVIPRSRCYIDTGSIGAKSSVTPEFAPVASPGNSKVSGCLSAVTHESLRRVMRRVPSRALPPLKQGVYT